MQSSNIAVLQDIDNVLYGTELLAYQRKLNEVVGWALADIISVIP